MTETFIETMTSHWNNTLNLTATDPLKAGWKQLQQAIDITANGQAPWQVLQLPTGAGKTEALKVLCASASPQNRTGILIVTKYIREANKLARDIDELAGEHIALAVHSEVKVTQDQINSSPVLVTTHSAYRNALIELADNDGPQMQWDRLNCYVQADRRWLIIDEAFDWVQNLQIDFSEIGSLCAALNGIPALEADIGLKQLTEFVKSLIEHSRKTSADWPLNELHRQQLKSLDIDALRTKLAGLSYTELDIWADIDKPKSAIRKAYSAVLQELKLIQNTDVSWVSKRGKRIHLNSSRLLMDVAKKRGVILDATATVDSIYELMGSRVKLLKRPTGIRSYANVTLNVSTGHRVGKEHLAEFVQEHWNGIKTSLSKHINSKTNMLVCCHKDVEPNLSLNSLRAQTVSTEHWGNMDGKNNWKDYDTGIIFGLPYLNDITPTNAFLACQPHRIKDWFQGDKTFGLHADMGQVFKDGFIAKSVLQAINRIRCRKAVDQFGNCEPVQLFLLRCKTQTGRRLLSAIQSQMPNVQTIDWDAGVAFQKTKPVPTEQKLLTFLKAAGIGIFTKSRMIEQLEITARTFERLSKKVQNSNSQLAKELAMLGVKYECSIGRGKEAHFIKT